MKQMLCRSLSLCIPWLKSVQTKKYQSVYRWWLTTHHRKSTEKPNPILLNSWKILTCAHSLLCNCKNWIQFSIIFSHSYIVQIVMPTSQYLASSVVLRRTCYVKGSWAPATGRPQFWGGGILSKSIMWTVRTHYWNFSLDVYGLSALSISDSIKKEKLNTSTSFQQAIALLPTLFTLQRVQQRLPAKWLIQQGPHLI